MRYCALLLPLSLGLAPFACGGENDLGLPDVSSSASASSSGGDPMPDAGPPPDAPPPPPACEPTGGGPYWILEGETVTFTVECATGIELAEGDISVGSLPEGAAFDPKTRAVTFTPKLDQAALYSPMIIVGSTGEKGYVKIGVADAWDNPANEPIKKPLAYTEEYGLPVLFLSPPPTTEEYAPATVMYRGHTYPVQAKLRGAASLGYPKKSYTLEFPTLDKFDEPVFAGGFKNKRKIVLISTFDDNSYVRQRLAYDLWNRLDPGHIQIQTYSAVVYMDGKYYGLYTVSDHVDGFLMEDHGLWQDGNLYKAVDHNANFRLTSSGGQPKQTLHDGFVKREGLPAEGQPGAFQDLEDLVSFVATSSSPDFLANVDTWIDRRDYENWWIFVTFVMGDDSAGKNSYHYHDPKGGVFRYAPWDFNASFGQTWQTARQGAQSLVEYKGTNRIFERFLDEPSIGDPLRARYSAVLQKQYSKEAVLALVDAYIAEIDASARRDEGKWQNAYQSYGGWSWRNDFTTYEQELAYLKQWIADRWAFQDAAY
jgi:spore coat protein CotH